MPSASVQRILYLTRSPRATRRTLDGRRGMAHSSPQTPAELVRGMPPPPLRMPPPPLRTHRGEDRLTDGRERHTPALVGRARPVRPLVRLIRHALKHLIGLVELDQVGRELVALPCRQE